MGPQWRRTAWCTVCTACVMCGLWPGCWRQDMQLFVWTVGLGLDVCGAVITVMS